MFRELTIRNLIPLVPVNLLFLIMEIKVVVIKKKFIRKRIYFFIDRFPLSLFKQNDIRIVYFIKFEKFFSEHRFDPIDCFNDKGLFAEGYFPVIK